MRKHACWTATLRFALIAVLVVLAATCKPDAVADPASEVQPTGTPLPQLAMIPVQIEVGDGTWASVHAGGCRGADGAEMVLGVASGE